ncbi:MAG: S41 family peptidase [Verrucomicrobiae bacterium]|nr:S41 family peptidase [Verrucomicrobiae bacterium]MDW8345207.1 S41 family peptidase [Verrucomicrobiae bacterium]
MTAKRVVTILVVAILGVNLALAARIYSAATEKTAADDPYAQFKLAAQVMELIRANHVDGDKVSYQRLTYDALKGMVSSLDPHSQFMEPEMYQDMQTETEGKFGGLGIVISMSKDNALTIVAPMEDTPGARAGLLPGDRIIKIDGRPTEKMTLQEAVKLLRGEPGTKVTISVFRPKAKDPGERLKDYTIERAEIRVESVKDVKMLTDNIGYIRITQFNQPTADEFRKALDKLEKQGMDALVIDLRNNPGGLLEAAIKVASEFVPRGELIVSTEGRDPRQTQRYYSVGGKRRPNYPIAVLINGGSASASEIVSGALQDTKRAVVVGETSFGKGSVQSVIKLSDGSALRLTTAKYYTPSHRVIHEHGVTPDILVPISEEVERKLMEQRARANLPPEEGEKVEPVPDEQLDRAVDVLKGVKLFARQMKAAGRAPRTTAALP